ncbi:tyrosine-type recombinase/integrase [Sphingomonas sp. A2-49]|uniref:tyrosine-type recombinase/integrase n=1 Tax=Sphingomonas sp. A2-49 TaxID=1391375 RepID=UPI0021D2605F|nr:tyrosine-type recombinase/integrase [Sphingomonas sp. A2-49]MCU6453977.1 tyrosine-type recombinase/integrase [Sphingomonas sp. A2-49]
MARSFPKLSRRNISALTAGQRLTEGGITVERTASGDLVYRVAAMVDGQRIHRTVGRESEGVTREQAERLIETLRTRAREDRLDLPTGRKMAPSFVSGAAAYIGRLSAEGGKGIERKSRHIEMRLQPFFGSFRIDSVSESSVREFVQLRRRGGAKAGTINRELATLSHMLRKLARWGVIAKDKVPTIERLREGAGRIVALSDGECTALLKAAREDQDGDVWLFVLICLQTSMRHGEARRLRWEHYDANRRRLFIPEAKAGERDQPIPPQLAAVLDDELRRRGVLGGYIFAGGTGSTTGYRHTFRKAFQRSVVRAGLDPMKVTPHVMRHTAITRLVKAGIDLPTIQRVSGHKTLSMVLRYAHVDGVHIDSAINHLGIAMPSSG